MSQAAYIRDMTLDSPTNLAASLSEVANFYTDQNVFLTGGTGFLGKLLIERILRSCPDVKTIFLLLREKRGRSPEERLEVLLNDVIFKRLRRERPLFARKVVLITGDIGQVGLGLSAEQRELLRSTHIVIHSAATVRFNAKLRFAVDINVRGTQEILSLAKEMVDLKAFVHISTAFCNTTTEVLEEKFYPPPIDADKLLSLLDILNDESLDHLTPVLLGERPNTYVFTKLIAEDVIRRNSQKLPLCIVRPSGILATSEEPIAGWIDNANGGTGIFLGAVSSLFRTVYCEPDMVIDFIPADYVVSSVIVAAWDIAETQSLNTNSTASSTVPEIGEPLIHNVVSSCQKPITWGKILGYTMKYMADIPSVMCLWYYCFRINNNPWIHKLFVIFLHRIPAAIIDSYALLNGRKPMLKEKYEKAEKLCSVLEYFMLHQWRFHNDNVLRLWERMSPVDRTVFNFDIGSLDWKEYSYRHVRGIRVYLLKDPMDTVPQGRARYAKLQVAHYILVTAVLGVLVWFLWTCLRLIGLL